MNKPFSSCVVVGTAVVCPEDIDVSLNKVFFYCVFKWMNKPISSCVVVGASVVKPTLERIEFISNFANSDQEYFAI